MSIKDQVLNHSDPGKRSKPVILEQQSTAFDDPPASYQDEVNGLLQAASVDDAYNRLINERDIRKIMIYPGFASGDIYAAGIAMKLDPKLNLVLLRFLGAGIIQGKNDKSLRDLNSSYLEDVEFRANQPRDCTANTLPYLRQLLGGEFEQRVAIIDYDELAIHNSMRFWSSHWQDQAKERCLSELLKTILSNEFDKSKVSNEVNASVELVNKWLNPDKIAGKMPPYILVDLFYGTYYVGLQKPDSVHQEASNALTQNYNADTVSTWLKAYFDNKKQAQQAYSPTGHFDLAPEARVLVYWSRFSGKRGGAHMEYDTGIHSIRQMLCLANSLGFDAVILAGDLPGSQYKVGSTGGDIVKRQQKVADIVSASQTFHPHMTVLNLTEFWGDENWKSTFKGRERIAQFWLYKYLSNQFKTVHLGNRSGNMENLALMGFCVGYLELFDDAGQDRMKQFSPHGYQRIEIVLPSSRTGKEIVFSKWDESKTTLSTGHPNHNHYNRYNLDKATLASYRTLADNPNNEALACARKAKQTKLKEKYAKPDVEGIKKGFIWYDIKTIGDWLETQM